MFVTWNDGEPCPHCRDNPHHQLNITGKPFHHCEFCNRISAKGVATMNGEDYRLAVACDWKEQPYKAMKADRLEHGEHPPCYPRFY